MELEYDAEKLLKETKDAPKTTNSLSTVHKKIMSSLLKALNIFPSPSYRKGSKFGDSTLSLFIRCEVIGGHLVSHSLSNFDIKT